MLVPLIPFLWSAIQISVLILVALLISWSLRGRAPQWTSAMLAAACVAALGLTMIIWLPTSHWSLTNNVLPTYVTIAPKPQDASPGSFTMKSQDASPGSFSSKPQGASPGSVAASHDQVPNTKDQPTLAISLNGLLVSTSNWLRFGVSSIDTELRRMEPTSTEYRVSLRRVQAICIAMFVIVAGLWLNSWLWIRSMVRNSRVIEDQALLARVRMLAERMNVKRLPELLESNRIAVGATIGYWRKRIVLNEQWREWTEDELDAVILHELAHMLRHDYAWVVITSWVRVLLFYHPMIHLLVRRLRMEQELAADQLAAGGMLNARAYGRALARLALRAECVAKVPSPVLTAEQVCIVRRITMLKQGRLKPMTRRWRLSAIVMALTLVCTAPLSGLRGTPPTDEQPVDEQPADKPTPTKEKDAAASESAEQPRSEKNRQAGAEFALTNKEFPPSVYEGRLRWQPGKLAAPATPPSLRYLQDLAAFVLLEQFAENAEINAPAKAALSWETRERKRGLFTFGATCNESQGIDPKFILRLITNPLFTNFKLGTDTKTIAGKTATRLVARGINPETRELASQVGAEHWFIQEGDEFYFGTEEDLIARLMPDEQSKEKSKESSAMIDVPEVLRENFQSAGLALVYSDCAQWHDRLVNYFKGTDKETMLDVAAPYLKDLKHLGIFLDIANCQEGENTLPLIIRIGYQTEAAAKEQALGFMSLLAMARMAPVDPDDAALIRDLLEHLHIFHVGQEIVVKLDKSKLADLFCEHVLPQKFVGWTDILALVSATKTRGTVEFECNHGFGSAGFLAQSIEAQPYLGKRVKVSAELGGGEDVHSRSGVILWGGDKKFGTTGNAVSGHSIGQPIDPKKAYEILTHATAVETAEWKTHTVEWDVPSSTIALSFGVYLAAGKAMVRNVKFEVVGDARGTSQTQLESLPRNLLQIPGRELLKQPTNLDFSEVPASVSEPTPVRAAARVEVQQTR